MTFARQGLDQFFSSSTDGLDVYAALPEHVAITFELDGPGGGTWSVSRRQLGDPAVVRGTVKRPDCRLRCSVSDFVALVNGQLNFRRAFLDDRMEVEVMSDCC